MLKKAFVDKTISLGHFVFNTKFLAGIPLYFCSSVIFVSALRGGELSVLYPMVSLGYIWVTLNSRIFLKEPINRFKLAGVSFIVLGIILIGISS
jgi:drug/metabolite transporter (DMT)-like permease